MAIDLGVQDAFSLMNQHALLDGTEAAGRSTGSGWLNPGGAVAEPHRDVADLDVLGGAEHEAADQRASYLGDGHQFVDR